MASAASTPTHASLHPAGIRLQRERAAPAPLRFLGWGFLLGGFASFVLAAAGFVLLYAQGPPTRDVLVDSGLWIGVGAILPTSLLSVATGYNVLLLRRSGRQGAIGLSIAGLFGVTLGLGTAFLGRFDQQHTFGPSWFVFGVLLCAAALGVFFLWALPLLFTPEIEAQFSS